jgi:PST family polysaccharide transporter
MVVCQSGLPDALIQREELRPEHEATGFWLTLVLAFGATGLLYLLAPAIARWMEMPSLSTGIALICLPLIIEGISASPGARLRRRLDFRAIAVAEVVAELAFLATALVVLLFFKMPRWTLPLGLGARLLVHGLWIWIADGYFPRSFPTLAAARELAHFVMKVWAAAAVEVVSENADYVLVGRLLGSSSLGYYTMAWDLLRFIPDRLHRMAGRVTLPEFCRLQKSNEKLGNAYLDFVSYIAKIIMPIITGVAIAAPELLATIYGSKWIPTAIPLRLLAPGLALVGLRMAVGSVYYAKNRPALDIYIHAGRLVLIVLAIYALATYDVAGVSAGMSLVESTISVAGIYLACELVELAISRFIAAVAPAFGLTVVCAIATTLGKLGASAAGVHGVAGLAFLITPPAIAFWLLEARTLRRFLSSASQPKILVAE